MQDENGSEAHDMKPEITLKDGDLSPDFRVLVNNPVADSWQNRTVTPWALPPADLSHEDALDLVGHTLNGRPIYRAWQLALLLGISPALLSTTFGSIPPNLRPFELYDDEYEAVGLQTGAAQHSISRNERTQSHQGASLGDLRRLAVLARSTESSGISEIADNDWNQLIEAFQEF
jgi:hypothetical protein